MYGQWGRSVDMESDGQGPPRGGTPSRPTSRVGPMAPMAPMAGTGGPQPRPAARAPGSATQSPGGVANHGGPVSPGRYLSGPTHRKDFEDDEEEDSAACSSVSD